MRVGAVQAEPVWIDSEGTLDKTITLMEEAVDLGATALAFPDLWIPGHPVFLSTHPSSTQALFRARYRAHSLSVGGPILQAVSRAARELSLVVVLGFSEFARNLLYASTQIIDADGRVVLHRRRNRLTNTESTLFSSHERAPASESPMTIAGRFALIDAVPPRFGREDALTSDLLVAPLPCLGLHQPEDGDGETDEDGEESSSPWGILSSLRSCAFDTARPVVSSSQIIGPAGAEVFATDAGRSPVVIGGGGFARVYGPDGTQLSGTLDQSRDGIVWADITRTRTWRLRG